MPREETGNASKGGKKIKAAREEGGTGKLPAIHFIEKKEARERHEPPSDKKKKGQRILDEKERTGSTGGIVKKASAKIVFVQAKRGETAKKRKFAKSLRPDPKRKGGESWLSCAEE